MNKSVYLDDVIDLLTEKLSMGGSVTFTPNGTSMLPMLRGGRDVVILKKPEGRLKKYDVLLYKGNDGKYILHRVVGIDKNRNYVMCGDNQFDLEYGITDEQIIAVVQAFKRDGKTFNTNSASYRIYVFIHCHTRLLRRICKSIARRVKGLFIKKD